MLKISSDVKFHPFHIKIYDLISQVSVQGSLAAVKFVLYPFSQEKLEFFKQRDNKNSKQVESEDKPEIDDGIQIDQKHLHSHSTKEKILRQTLIALTKILSLP
jgi:hypothetical protein